MKEKQQKNMNKSIKTTAIWGAVSLLLFVALITLTVSLAYLSGKKDIDGASTTGQATIVSITNPTTSSPIAFSKGATKDCGISIKLSANVDCVVRIKIAFSYYDNYETKRTVPDNVTPNLSTSQGGFVSDEYGLCYYFNANAKDITDLEFISSITFDDDLATNDLYVGLNLRISVDAEILQQKVIDYSSHPWRDNAPTEWLERAKNNFA